jgi:hypothetical protein
MNGLVSVKIPAWYPQRFLEGHLAYFQISKAMGEEATIFS